MTVYILRPLMLYFLTSPSLPPRHLTVETLSDSAGSFQTTCLRNVHSSKTVLSTAGRSLTHLLIENIHQYPQLPTTGLDPNDVSDACDRYSHYTEGVPFLNGDKQIIKMRYLNPIKPRAVLVAAWMQIEGASNHSG